MKRPGFTITTEAWLTSSRSISSFECCKVLAGRYRLSAVHGLTTLMWSFACPRFPLFTYFLLFSRGTKQNIIGDCANDDFLFRAVSTFIF